jgi:hypothetical protein
MATPLIAQYTFLPWARRGIGSNIPDADTLGAGDGPALLRAALTVELTLTSTPLGGAPVDSPAIAKVLQLLGPGDIRGVRPEAIVREHPRSGTTAFEAVSLAYLDFYEEDFPWRYTPARAAAPGEPADHRFKLRPWIALWVLADDEFAAGGARTNLPPSIALVAAKANACLPLQTETWAWAHTQISKRVTDVSTVDAEIRADPDHALARLVSPRRLAPDTSYHAFLVPAFETGRLAGLGEDPSAIPAQAPSWRSGAMPHSIKRPLEYPVYHQWSFRTGSNADFESLVRALTAGPVGPEFGKRDVDTRAPGFGMDGIGPSTMAVEGALRPPTFSRAPYPATPGAAFEDRLESILDVSESLEQGQAIAVPHPYHVDGAPDAYGPDVPDDPILTPPVFGKWHAGVARLFDARNDADLAWLRELNLDPRNRAAAGLGVEVIQRRQDELVERAWQQVGEVERANRRLRHAELAAAASEAVFDKHFARDDSDRVLRLTAAAHRRMLAPAGTATLHAEVKASQVPGAVMIGTFKRVTRPQQKVIRQLAGSGSIEGFQRDLVGNFNLASDPLTAAPPKPAPEAALGFQDVSAAVSGSIGDFETEGTRPRYFFMDTLAAELAARLGQTPPADLSTLNLGDFRAALDTRLNARTPPVDPDKKIVVDQLIDAISAVAPTAASSVNVEIPPPVFDNAFGADIAGKSYRGVTVIPSGPPRVGEISKMTAAGDLQDFQGELAALNSTVLQARVDPTPPSPLPALSPLAAQALTILSPRTALVDRVAAAISGVSVPGPAEPRRLKPVMAYPVFTDAMFEDLRARSADFIIPNYADLPASTITLLEDNDRFIASFMSGLNHEMARELLWREYPTDQRGTYFRAFWDTRDAADAIAASDIKPMDQWAGELDSQSARPGGHLVLVIRGELLRKYPSTVVYAQRGAFAGADVTARRELADESVATNVRFPIFRGDLKPDISIFGFLLSEAEARGHRPSGPSDSTPPDPGWFFVLKERPGEPSFGLDDAESGAPALGSWNDLSWGHLAFPPDSPNAIAIVANPLVLDGTGGPDDPTDGTWGKSAADMAYILLQDPVLYARHADELLP